MGYACDCSDWGASDETAFNRERIIKARKTHRCCECGQPIENGQLYERAVGASHDGEFWYFATCLPCRAIRRDYCPNGYCYSYLADQIHDCMGWDYRDTPDEIELDEEGEE